MDENTNVHMTLSEELLWRGMINQTTLTDVSFLDKKPLVFYHGFDASAPSQTIGNLAAMMTDLVFLRHGHKAIILAGGSTSLIGDPGGRDKERPMQGIETIENNIEKAKTQIEKIYKNFDFVLVNNIDWTKNVSIIDFLRDVGKYFNVSEMIKKEYIANRLGSTGISFTEFSYELFQGFDYLYLFEKYNCTLQIGGADQWTNCLAGVDLIRKKLEKDVHCLTLPLVINRATGKKFGKSEQGAVWLDKELTSVYDFYQFWLNVDDISVKEYLKLFTPIAPEEYTTLISEFEKDYASRIAQKYLALSVTTLVHGEEEALKAKNVATSLFGKQVSLDTEGIVEVIIQEKYLVGEVFQVIDFLVDNNIVSSKREGRDLVQSRGIYIDGVSIGESSCLLKGNIHLLRIGKKRHYKLIRL